MDLVFTTDNLEPAKRYNAWREAICDFYVHVDVKATRPEQYRGYIREAKFGEVVMTDILLPEQRIRRSNQHISRLDKDCYYLQLIQRGNLNVVQRGAVHHVAACGPGGALHLDKIGDLLVQRVLAFIQLDFQGLFGAKAKNQVQQNGSHACHDEAVAQQNLRCLRCMLYQSRH